MKRKLFYLIAFAIALSWLLGGCIVTSSSYSIVFQNDAGTGATLKVGTNSFWVAGGANAYFVYYIEQDNAKVSVDGVSIEAVYYMPPGSAPAEVKSVNLIFGYQFNFTLVKSGSDYIVVVTPVKVDGDTEISDVLNF